MSGRDEAKQVRVATVLEDSAPRRLSRRDALKVAATGVAGLYLSGCSGATGGGASGKVAAGSLAGKPVEHSLQLYNWTDYDDPRTPKLFQQRYGARVVQSYFQSNDELVAKMEAGGAQYDIITPSQSVIPRLIEGGHVRPLDHSLIPNLKHLAPEFQQVRYDPGNKYSVTKDWGITGFYWRKDVIAPSDYPKTLLEAFEMLPRYQGKRINFMDGASEVLPICFAALGLDMNTEDEADYQKVYAMLKRIWPAITTFSSVFIDKVGAGAIDIGLGWNGDVAQGMAQAAKRGIEYHFMVPPDKGEYWTDNWLVAADAPHPVAAHKWIDFMLDPKIAARETDYLQFGTPVPAALDLVHDKPLVSVPSAATKRYDASIDTPKTASLHTKYWNMLKS